MATLILVRHGESQFNAKSLWTGIWDVPLTKRGRDEAGRLADAIAPIKPDVAYTSNLSRAKDTLDLILSKNKWAQVKVHSDAALNERDYGDLTGMNKWTVEERYGVAQFKKWRRGWNEPVPDGETLKDVYRRVVPYFEANALIDLKAGKNVLIAAHGNSLRALMKYLDSLSDHQVESLEMLFGEVVTYNCTTHGVFSNKKTNKLSIPPTSA